MKMKNLLNVRDFRINVATMDETKLVPKFCHGSSLVPSRTIEKYNVFAFQWLKKVVLFEIPVRRKIKQKKVWN